jgi:hypothetical protein
MALKTAYILRRPVVEIRFGRVCCAWAILWEHTVAVVCEFGRVEANCRVLLSLLALTNAGARWPSVEQRALVVMFTCRGWAEARAVFPGAAQNTASGRRDGGADGLGQAQIMWEIR